MANHFSPSNHSVTPYLNFQTLLSFNEFPVEVHWNQATETPVYMTHNSTPYQQSSNSNFRMTSRLIQQPDWLPLGWKVRRKIRTSGASAGRVDKYFISPTGQMFRSKVAVQHYLETGIKRKNIKKLKTDPDSAASESSVNTELTLGLRISKSNS